MEIENTLNNSQELFLVLFSILYGAMLQSLTGFHAFSWALLRRGYVKRCGSARLDEEKLRECKKIFDECKPEEAFSARAFKKWLINMWKKRLFVSLTVLIFCPFLYFFTILILLNGKPHLLGESISICDFFHVLAIFWSALGVFGFYRIYHAIVAWKWRTLFCDVAKELEEKRKLSFDIRANLYAVPFYLLPQIVYLLIFHYLVNYVWIWYVFILIFLIGYVIYFVND